MPVKIEEGKSFHAGDYFYVGDPEKTSTWKLKKGGSPGVVDRVHVSAAASAIGPRPAHGQRAQIPSAALAGVKSRIKAAMRQLDYDAEEMRESFAWLFGEMRGQTRTQERPVSDPACDLIDVEVFRVGDYGDKGKYTERDLDLIAEEYDPGLHEAPVTVDHKKIGPAYGWVRGLRRAGGKLIAKLGDVGDGLVDAIRKKQYRKVSVEIYKKLRETGRPYLRAVSFLGAQTPEIKGLCAVELGEDEEGDFVMMDFEEEEIKNGTLRRSTRRRSYGGQGDEIYKEGGDEEMELKELEDEKAKLEAKFAEAEGKLKAAEEERKTAEEEKATAVAALKKETEKFAEAEAKRKKEGALAAAKAWVKAKVVEGYITPAQEKAGLPELICHAELLPDENVITFGESPTLHGGATEVRPVDVLKSILSQVKILTFEEIAKPEAIGTDAITEFAEKAKAAGVSVREYKEAAEKVKPYGDDAMTPEKWIEAQRRFG